MYKAILFSPDGDYVSDFYDRKTIQSVWDEINDMGSKWIFYPLPFVCTDKTVIDTPEGMDFFKNKRISTLQKYLKNQWKFNAEEICEVINNGYPLDMVYH